jgi:hypothetical protein
MPERFKSIAASGGSSQNCERDLHLMTKADTHIKHDWLRLPLRSVAQRTKSKRNIVGIRPKVTWDNWPCIPLWETFRFIMLCNKWEAMVQPTKRIAEEFWGDFVLQDYSREHSIRKVAPDHYGFVIPLHIHIDGVNLFKCSGENTELVPWL